MWSAIESPSWVTVDRTDPAELMPIVAPSDFPSANTTVRSFYKSPSHRAPENGEGPDGFFWSSENQTSDRNSHPIW